MLASNGTPIQAFDQNAWAETFSYNRRDPKTSLETFRALRQNNLRLLNSVPRRLWENHGQHSERGKETVDHVMKHDGRPRPQPPAADGKDRKKLNACGAGALARGF